MAAGPVEREDLDIICGIYFSLGVDHLGADLGGYFINYMLKYECCL